MSARIPLSNKKLTGKKLKIARHFSYSKCYNSACILALIKGVAWRQERSKNCSSCGVYKTNIWTSLNLYYYIDEKNNKQFYLCEECATEVDPDNFLYTYFLCREVFHFISSLIVLDVGRYIRSFYFDLYAFTPGVPRILTHNMRYYQSQLQLFSDTTEISKNIIDNLMKELRLSVSSDLWENIHRLSIERREIENNLENVVKRYQHCLKG